MNARTKSNIVRLAQRMLAVQLEANPKARLEITFWHARHEVEVMLCDDGTWVALAAHWDDARGCWVREKIAI